MSGLTSLSEIIIYPIKSLAGISLEQSKVNPEGLMADRMMMLVDEHGLFITQRTSPRLALLNVTMSENTIRVARPDGNFVLISEASFSNQTINVRIWKDDCSGSVATSSINAWFSQFLGVRVQLIKYDRQNPRATDPEYANENDIVSFADGFPLLVISQASLDDLNQKLNVSVTMKNFRPNIVVASSIMDGADAYAEDHWRRIKLGAIIFDAVKLCSRCILTSVDPKTGRRREDREPLKTLSEYRKINGQVCFGMNLIPRSKGEIRIGDRLEIIESF